MIFLNELKDGILYKKPSYLPIDQKNKKTGSAVFLLTPNYDSSKKIMESEIILQKYFESYFIEKDITYYINQENALVRRSDEVVTEGFFSKPKVQKYKESELLEDYKNVKKKLAEKKFVILDRNDPLHDVINSYKENYLWANDIPCRYLLYSDDKNNTFLPIMTFTDSFDPNNSHPYAYFIGCKKNNVKNKVFLYCIYSEGEDKASIGDTIDIQFKYTTNTNESFIIESSIPKLNEVIKLNKKLNEYEYGFIVDGKITDDFENFWRDYRTISPKDFEKNKGGVCWDYVEYQNTQLTKMGLSCFTYYIELNDKMSSTHTFTVISADKIIYIESAYGKIQGVWEARSLQDIFNFILKNMFEDDSKISTFQIYEFSSPINKYGMNTLQYMNYIKKNGKKINHEYNSQKPIISLTEDVNITDKRYDFQSMKRYKTVIIGEVHSREMIEYYDNLLSIVKPEYLIAEMAYGDACLTQEELKSRLDNASDGTMKSPCDYQLNYWLYELAYNHNVKLIGCDVDIKVNKSHWGKLSKGVCIEDSFKKRENHMLNIIKKYDSKKCVVQLGDAHLRSIPWTKKFQEWSDDRKYYLEDQKENCVSYNSCIWEYYKDNRSVLIVREPENYQNELNWNSRSIHEDFHKDAELYRKQQGDSLVDVIIKMDLENLADKMDSFTEEEAIVQLLGSYKRKGYDTHLLMEFRDRYKNVLRWIRKKKDIIDPQEYIDYKNNQLKEIPKSKIKEIEKKVVAQQGSLPDRFGVIESNLLLEVVNTKKIYHLSQSNLDGKTLNPSIPDNFMTKNGYEDAKTPRISFAKSIDGCLRGLSQKCTNMELYVHEPIVDKNVKIKNISNHDVPDASITGETWITTPVKVKCIGKIKVIGDKGEKGIPYKYGNKTAELYNWNWKWVNRVSESYNEYIIESDNSIGYMTQTSISNDIFLRCKLDGIQKYMETVDVECVDEMSVSNKIDNEFQKKEKINISKIQKVKLDERIIDKYESGNPSLKHLRISNDYTGYFYLYNNKPVGYINVNKDTHTAQAMELFKDFQGMGLSDDLLKDAKTLKADNLTVNKNNEVAIDIYKKNGFRTYKSTDNMLFMKLNSSKIQQIKEFNDVMIVYPDCLEESYINEASGNANNVLLRKLMYAERFRTPKEVFAIYDQVKADFPWISKTYLTYDRYMMYNMFIDLSFYNQTFFKNNIYKLDKGVDLYFDFVNRFLNDARLLKASYTNRTVIIPVNDWKSEGNIWMYNEDVNPISMITRLAMKDPEKFRNWAGINFVFMSDNAYFKIDFATFDKKSLPLFLTLIKKLKNNEQPIDDPTDNITDSKQAIVADIIDKIETSQKIKINNLTGNSGEITKDELVQKVTQAASISTDVEQALDQLDKDEKLKEIIAALSMEEDNTLKLNAARTVRMTHLNDEFLNKEINKKPIRDLLKEPERDELPITALKIDSVNPEWQEMRYMNFEKAYDVDADIVKILMSFSKKSIPIAMRDITVTDESTAEDWIYTYNVQCEDGLGQRYSLKFDIPKFKDNKFMLLRGNEKTINGQLVQIPIMKTDEDTVQIVSNYNKIFVRRFGTTTGKSFVSADKIIKVLNKYQGKGITITRGDNSKISMKYDLPIDYIDIGSEFSILETKNCIIYFSQDEIRSKYKMDDKDSKYKTDGKKGIPFGYSKDTKEVLYYNSEEPISDIISYYLTLDEEFRTLYIAAKPASKYTYSKASILNTEIPVIVVMGYTCGLIGALSKAGIVYQIEDKKPKESISKDFIKFKDGYINYTLDYNSSLLMNGLKDCNTEDYLLADMNNKTMWLDFLDSFGGRIKADGLDNFADLMIDPITEEVLDHYKLPTDYMELLAYANRLLEDNKFIKHTSTAGRRYRSNEIIAGYVYKALSEAYGDFKNKSKRISKGSVMTIKQSDVIDKILLDPTASDLSILNPLLEIESANAISYKGLSGMNSDRAYSLDKRTFDDSMLNVLALSTGFAGNVGITRQATVDMNIEGKRGYIKETKDKNALSVTKTLCMTEALTPFGTTRDDPFRSAMTFIQTSKHGMRIRNSCPQLITNGADEALPYMISNTFAHKSKMAGKVVEKTDDYMILAYKDGSNEMVSLIDEVKKNSSGGFFTTIKLDTDLKEGSTFKENEILAYDKLSFSNKIGNGDNLSYNLGSLVKIAILNTDEGYEDSAIISDWLSSAMSSDVVVKKEITLPKNTNIYKMAEVGQPIQEGEPLVIFQNAFDEEDINILLKNLSGDEADISELGRVSIKSKITGVVQDIKMYRTVEKDEMSDSLKKQFNKHEKPIKEYRKVIEKYKVANPVNLEPDYKLEPTGKLKNAKDSVLIEFYLKYEDNMSIGDKLIYYSALKGVIKDIFPVGKEPYSDLRKDETVHSLLAIGSVNGRMVCSVEVNALINKVLIELDRKVKEKLGIKFKMLDKM